MVPPQIGETATNRFKRDQGRSSTEDTIRVTSKDEIATVFDSLNDSDARTIMQVLDDATLSAKEISDHCELPMSTTYRKLNQLSDLGLLEENTEISLEGKHVSTYRRSIDNIEISITDDGFELELSGRDTPETLFG